MQKAIRQKGRLPHVAIIGAGISGLRCADVLINSGVRVTIYEARDRIGGRVHQVESGGRPMDIGANWIHGSQNNPIAAIARKNGSIIHEPGESHAVIDSLGTRIDDELAMEISEAVWATIARAFQYSDEHSAAIDKSTSLMDYFREQIRTIAEDPQKRSLILEAAQTWGAFVGDSIERQSLKFFFLEECIDGENTFVADTHKKILADVAATALSKAEIRFNEEVVFFDTRDSGPGTSPDPTTIVHTRSGKQQRYDEVVISAPLGWLKMHARHAFPAQSPLPPRLLQAIDNASYGRLEKVYISFPTAFWQVHDISSHTVSPVSSSSQHNSTSSASLPRLSSPISASTYPFSTDFHTPSYIPHPPGIPWNQTMINLAALPTTATAQPTLLFYLYGDCGTHLVSQLANDTVTQQTSTSYHLDDDNFNLLISFFKPYYSLLPNYSSDDPSCTPTTFLTTNWQSDPHAGYGSYTNFQVGLEEGDRDVEVMRYGGVEVEAENDHVESVNIEGQAKAKTKDNTREMPGLDPQQPNQSRQNRTQDQEDSSRTGVGIGRSRGIWLAGEHTAPFIALGTTTGAYWSGEAVAGRILQLYRHE